MNCAQWVFVLVVVVGFAWLNYAGFKRLKRELDLD